MGNGNKIFRKTIGVKFVKRVNWTFSRMRKVTDWTVWRGRPPPKRKKKLKV
jgi:hypothetical protein